MGAQKETVVRDMPDGFRGPCGRRPQLHWVYHLCREDRATKKSDTWGGDANLNGELNSDDYFIIDSNVTFAQNSPPFPAGIAAHNIAAVPEPVASTLGIVVGAAALRRRRRA